MEYYISGYGRSYEEAITRLQDDSQNRFERRINFIPITILKIYILLLFFENSNLFLKLGFIKLQFLY